MKGINELRLNQATIVEAVQQWLNSQMVNAPTVKDVSWNTVDCTFDVKVQREEQE